MDKEKAYQRFIQSIGYLKDNGKIHKQQDIAVAIGISKSYMSDVMKDRGGKFSEDFLSRFAAAYSDYINEDWLLTGAGDMAKPEKQMHPFLEAKAAAGFLGGGSIAETGDDLRDLNSFFPDYNFMIKVQGSSMEPIIYDGDVLICRSLTDSLNPPENRVCVIDTKEDVLVKEIAGTEDGYLILHSYNPKVPDQRVEFSAINGIALVVGSLRPNM